MKYTIDKDKILLSVDKGERVNKSLLEVAKENNIIVLGVSYDNPEKLNKFRKKHNLPFTLISDKDKTISKLYNSGGMLFTSRKTIIINPEGVILNIIDNVNIDTHSDDIMKIVLDEVKSKESD